jgi:hypothetical protein
MRVSRYTPARLRAKPRKRIHPLRLYLLERGVSLKDGAKYLNVHVRTIMNLVAWQTAPNVAWRDHVARELGFKDPERLFPPLDRSEDE